MAVNKTIKRIAVGVGRIIPDKLYLSIRYYYVFHKKINWKKPQSYNEKLQWMKIYDRNDLYTKLVDKEEVKKIVGEKIGFNHIIPTLAVWDNANDIDISELPDQFVLKCTHDSGSVMICRDKKLFNVEEAKEYYKKKLSHSTYYGGREWAYKNVKPRIIAEQYMTDETKSGLKDYKFFCFDGKVKCMFIATDRGADGEDVKFDFFDKEFNHLPIKHGHENAKMLPLKPDNYDEMCDLAESLSKGLRHVRVDLYNVNGDIYFGEMTFYHHCGFVPFDPEQWDTIFGDWINL